MHSSRTLGSTGRKGLCFTEAFTWSLQSRGGKKQQDEGLPGNTDSYPLNTLSFSNRGNLNDHNFPLWTFSELFRVCGLTSTGEKQQTLQFPVPWPSLLWKPLLRRQPRELLWTCVSHCCIYALISHLSCSKQQKRFICIHPQLQSAVISLHALLRAPAAV